MLPSLEDNTISYSLLYAPHLDLEVLVQHRTQIPDYGEDVLNIVDLFLISNTPVYS